MKLVEKDLETYFRNALKESISAIGLLDTSKIATIVGYYGNEDECTIENYFDAQIANGNLYDSTQEFIEDTFLGEVDDCDVLFDDVRNEVFQNWLDDLVDSTDESELVDVSDRVEINPIYDGDILLYNEVLLDGKESDMVDSEMSTIGDDLFVSIFYKMTEQNASKAAYLAGAKYVYVEYAENNRDYILHFWK